MNSYLVLLVNATIQHLTSDPAPNLHGLWDSQVKTNVDEAVV
jgi:hypothetical protein